MVGASSGSSRTGDKPGERCLLTGRLKSLISPLHVNISGYARPGQTYKPFIPEVWYLHLYRNQGCNHDSIDGNQRGYLFSPETFLIVDFVMH